MNPLCRRLLPTLLALLSLAVPTLAAADAEAVIVGQVSNRATGANLQGALVTLDGTDRSALTDAEGVYRLRLPAGTHALTLSYAGLDPERFTLTAAAGATLRRDATLTTAIYQLSALVVATEREGNALAHTQQRHAPNVKNIVSSDAFGALSGNPAELLERLTGVVVDRVGGDARFISIRGIAGALNSVQIDGNRRAAAESRGLQFESIGSDHIESMELVKAPTPDMDADAIGGTVNLRSRSAFDVNGRRFTYSVGGLIGARRYRAPLPAGTLHFSDVFNAFAGRRNLGISFSANFRQHLGAMDLTTMNYQNTTASPAYLYSLAYDGRTSLRTRWGAGLKVDYKLDEARAVFANFTFSPHSERATVPVTTVATAQTVATLNAQGQPTGTGAILPGYTDDRTEARALAASTVGLSTLRRVRDVNAYSAQLGGRHRGARSLLDYDLSYSFSDVQDFPWTGTATLRNVGWILDRAAGDRWAPALKYTAGPDPANLDLYTDNLLTHTRIPVTSRILGAQVNYRHELGLAFPAFVKAGARVRREELRRENLSRRWRFAGRDNLLNSGDENLAQFRDTALSYRPMHGRYPGGPFLSADAMRAGLAANPSAWPEDVAFGTMNPLVGRQRATEEVQAAYALGQARLGRLTVLTGVRLETTAVEAEGAVRQLTAAERARRAAFTGPLTNEEILRRNLAQYGGRRTAARDYQHVFPGLHLKHEPLRGLQLRASYSTGIGRPAFASIIPNDTIDDDARVLTVNNTGLRPQYAVNLDAGVDYYFEPVGLVSVGVFRKNLTDFIYPTTGQAIAAGPDNGFEGNYVGYELRSQANGGSARVEGFEASYQQQFTFLPGAWGGLGAFANYTRLTTEGDYGVRGAVQTTGTLPGFTPSAANLGLSYIRGRWNLRAAYGMAGEILMAYNAAPNLRRYRLASHRVELKLNFRLNRSYDVYLDAYNLTNDRQREVWGVHGRPRTILDRNDPQFHFGLNGRL